MATEPRRKVEPTDEDIAHAEQKVLERRVKERRRADRFGRWVERGMVAILLGLYIIGFVSEDNDDEQRARDFGAAVLINCVKTEDLKQVIRGVLRQSIETTERFKDIPGFGPEQRAEQIDQARDNIARFAAQDCLKLDAVELAVGEGLDAEAVRRQARRGVERRRQEAHQNGQDR